MGKTKKAVTKRSYVKKARFDTTMLKLSKTVAQDLRETTLKNPDPKSAAFTQFLLNVTNEITAAKNLDQALEKLVDITTGILGAERGTIFINDSESGELYSRVAQGNFRREIRIMNNSGIAGWVYTNDEPVMVKDPYKDSRFNQRVDERTGFKTRNIICAPLKTLQGEIIGVSQILNKKSGSFTKKDLAVLQAITQQAAFSLQSNLSVEKIEAARQKELEFLNIVSQVSSEVQLGPLLEKIMSTVTKMLNAERSTLFINDEKTKELYTEIADGLGTRIRFPNHLGIAGTVFSTGESINIPHAYADLRFNPAFDKKTGFFTRSILCTPIFNKAGKTIGVTQVLNKRGENFTEEDEARLKAFTSQIAIGIENAKLFDDVQNMKNYNESVLESMSSGVITLDDEGVIVMCNKAGRRILKMKPRDIIAQKATDIFTEKNVWMMDKLANMDLPPEEDEDGNPIEHDHTFLDTEITVNNEPVSANVTLLPLLSDKDKKLGAMILIEDISNEKRMKSTMSKYMDPGLADKLMAGGDDMLGGTSSVATVLFSDIRSFTTITEELGAQGTVNLLNEYFTVMVDCVQKEGGMLDKFIGDALMAIFGTPFPHEDDVDRGLRSAISMMTELQIFNRDRQAKGKMPVMIGIGLNTGHVVSGNIGSPKRMDYTVIGDGVNLAARLESACKQYGAKILISEFTYAALKSTYRTRKIDNVVVKGKTEAVGVYEVLDFHNDESFPNMVAVLDHFNNGFGSYLKGKWDAATKSFSQALKLHPEDKPSQMYIDRCKQLKKSPPKGKWEGIWVMTSK
ncbi:MAG: adenylate cyclase [Candidatus Marinamargulisbacteria bacterium]|jgi:adenylate cyclase